MEQITLNNPHIQTTIGYKNTVIQDLLNQDFYMVDNKEDVASFFQDFKEFVFQVPENLIHCFPDLNFEYSNPNLIDNAIIKYNKKLNYNILNELLNTCQLYLYADEIENKNDFLKLLNSFNGQIITILINNQKLNLSTEDLDTILHKYYNILDLYLITSCSIGEIKVVNQTTVYYFDENEYNKSISYDKKLSCFRSNLQLYTESQSHHTYFNRKLYIGYMGEIKNSPNSEEIFGYMSELETTESLKTIIKSYNFQKYWSVHKNICDVCKDCEFRHICVDNRIPFQRSSNEWYHKQECNYNPYISKWKGEEGYHTLEECGVVCNEDIFFMDSERVKKINNMLWI